VESQDKSRKAEKSRRLRRRWCALFFLLRNDLVRKEEKVTEVVRITKQYEAKNDNIHPYC